MSNHLTWKKPCFKETEEKPAHKESSIAFGESHAHSHDTCTRSDETTLPGMIKYTPEYHDRTEPCRGCNLPNQNVARYFKENVGDKKDEEGDVVIVAFHLQVFLQPLNSGIADVDSIDESKHVEQGNSRYHMEIAFPNESPLCYSVDRVPV